MGQILSILIPTIIGCEIGRRIGIVDQIISEMVEDPRFNKYQRFLKPNIPHHLKTKIDRSITLLFLTTLLWIYYQNPFMISIIVASSIYAFTYDFCQNLRETASGTHILSLLYTNTISLPGLLYSSKK